MGKLSVLPKVKKVELTEGYYVVEQLGGQLIKEELVDVLECALAMRIHEKMDANLEVVVNRALDAQAYTITISEKGVQIEYSDLAGLFYAGITLKHMLKQYGYKLPYMKINDAPDLQVRGMLYDISRNKVPKLETLYHLVDVLADLKYNQLQLYIEGLSYEYSHYKQYLEDTCYLTKKEIKALETYCKKHFIDLVPNQNTLGHMADWLAIEELKKLRRNPDEEMAFGMMQQPATLDPENPESITLIENITEDMLSVFESVYYNVNLDETFGLEESSLYVEWVRKMHTLSQKYNRQMMMWGDMLITYKDSIHQLPKDLILLDWGYEDHYPFHTECKAIQESGFKFYVCPGTSTWVSIAGRTKNMLGNVDKAILCAHQYGASGMVMTEWGDAGHWQSFAISYPAISYAAARAWNKGGVTEEALATYLDTFIYCDATKQMGKLALDTGRCNEFDDFRLLNGSFIHHHFKMGLCELEKLNQYKEGMIKWMIPYANRFYEDGGKELIEEIECPKAFDYDGLMAYVEKLEHILDTVILKGVKHEQVYKEYKQTLHMVKCSANIRFYIEHQTHLTEDAAKVHLQCLDAQMKEMIDGYEKNWLARNKKSHLEASVADFKRIVEQIHLKLEVLG